MKNIKKYNEFTYKKELFDIIPNSIKQLNNIFKKYNKKLYLVGGSVRDFITGDTPKDFDLATDALPDEIVKILDDNKYKYNLQGKAFGVVVVYTNDQPMGIEIATFREDLSKGRNPEVKLGVSINDDVKRRDISYNALFYDISKREIVDLVNGIDDLNNNISKMVGNAIERFDEDSLRILRLFRFSSRYNHNIHKDTEEGIRKRNKLENFDPETKEIKRISQERIWEEFIKSFKQVTNFNNYLNLYTKFDMWGEVFPNSNINTKLVESNNLIIILSNLFINEDLYNLDNKLVQLYKIDSEISRKVIFLISLLNFKSEDVFDIYKKKIQCNIDNETINEWIDLNVKKIKDINLFKFNKFKPSVNSIDLINKGFKGIELGQEIKKQEYLKFIDL